MFEIICHLGTFRHFDAEIRIFRIVPMILIPQLLIQRRQQAGSWSVNQKRKGIFVRQVIRNTIFANDCRYLKVYLRREHIEVTIADFDTTLVNNSCYKNI